MEFSVYHIQNAELRKFVPYILFNKFSGGTQHTLTCYANSNICLGIIKERSLVRKGNNVFGFDGSANISSYITGVYLKPHQVIIDAALDEICIDFSLEGYNRFFPFSCNTYLLGENVLREAFGANGESVFVDVFEMESLVKRGKTIEQFLISLLNKSVASDKHLIASVLEKNFDLKRSELAHLFNCSEKTVLHRFQNRYDVSIKEFCRVLRFRKAINAIRERRESLTSVAHSMGYFDQSHFIKEFNFFTGASPKAVNERIIAIDNSVLCSLS